MFNAAEALGVDVSAVTSHVTSVQFCLSKVWYSRCSKYFHVVCGASTHDLDHDLESAIYAADAFHVVVRYITLL